VDSPTDIPDEFWAMVESYRPSLLQQAALILGNLSDAEDVVQETLFAVARQYKKLGGRSLGGWLRAVNRLKAVDRLRQRKSDSRRLEVRKQRSEETLTTGGFSQLELRDSLTRAMTGLPEHLREAVRLRLFEHRSYKEIAERLKIPIGNVSWLLMDASAALYARLKDQLPGAPPVRNTDEDQTKAASPVDPEPEP
jgi:RNA polymerase sigma-70 factor (ECF subfamily)